MNSIHQEEQQRSCWRKVSTKEESMNRYQLLKDNEDTIYLFVKAGILSFRILRDIDIYESYLEHDEEIKNNQLKYILLAEQYELAEKTIEQIVYSMQKDIN
jgi:DNA polymerase III delta prime subunit